MATINAESQKAINEVQKITLGNKGFKKEDVKNAFEERPNYFFCVRVLNKQV